MFANGDKYGNSTNEVVALLYCYRYTFIEGEYIQSKKNSTGPMIARQGNGVQQLSNGIVYSGVWDNDAMNGGGRYTSANAYIYIYN